MARSAKKREGSPLEEGAFCSRWLWGPEPRCWSVALVAYLPGR